jgi:hypothetical protein
MMTWNQSGMSHGKPVVYALLGTPQVLQRALDSLPAAVAPYLNLLLQEISLKKLPPKPAFQSRNRTRLAGQARVFGTTRYCCRPL